MLQPPSIGKSSTAARKIAAFGIVTPLLAWAPRILLRLPRHRPIRYPLVGRPTPSGLLADARTPDASLILFHSQPSTSGVTAGRLASHRHESPRRGWLNAEHHLQPVLQNDLRAIEVTSRDGDRPKPNGSSDLALREECVVRIDHIGMKHPPWSICYHPEKISHEVPSVNNSIWANVNSQIDRIYQ